MALSAHANFFIIVSLSISGFVPCICNAYVGIPSIRLLLARKRCKNPPLLRARRVSTEMSLQVLAYNLKRVMNILGVAGTMKAMKMVRS
ncbi:hypothetical protein F6X39_07540 [Paraburkholderia sp. UCT2]|nr:hypothetical protein [Paraburkholderia sp. UCT2]